MKLCVCHYGYVAETFLVESEEECRREGVDCYTEALDEDEEEYGEEYEDEEEETEEGEKFWWEGEAEEDDDP